ncbi:MAG: hypothetical protein HFF14_08055 [Angelakisella sp.]|nr:hypothetical protein [Angelakisella sp.]
MKKVLALVLAVMMMATVAFAYDVGSSSDFGGETAEIVAPGSQIRIYAEYFANAEGTIRLSDLLKKGQFSSENFTVTTKRFDKGSNLVKSVEFNDDENAIDIKLNDNYDLRAKETINLVIKEIKVTAKKKIDNDRVIADGPDAGKEVVVAKGSKWTYINNEVDFRIGHVQVSVDIAEDFEVPVEKDSGAWGETDLTLPARSTNMWSPLVKFVKADGGPAYGDATITFGEAASASGRVYKDDVVYLEYDEDVNVDIVKKYPDADLSFVTFKGAPTFNSNMELEIYADEDTYIYEVKDNKIAPCSLKWDDDAYAFTGKVRTLGAYVVSDTKLSVDTTAADGNPDTGANDVVGIATALAAVALVSAAAVSLKK